MTAHALEASMAMFRANPLTAQTVPSVTATLVEGHGRLDGGPFAWEVDLPPVVGGRNQAPSPTLYLLGALAGSAVAFIHDTLAPQIGVQLAGVTATARCRSDLRGLFGVDGADPRLTGLSIEIAVDSSDSPERVEELRRAWLQRCPIYLALLNPVPVQVSWANADSSSSHAGTADLAAARSSDPQVSSDNRGHWAERKVGDHE